MDPSSVFQAFCDPQQEGQFLSQRSTAYNAL